MYKTNIYSYKSYWDISGKMGSGKEMKFVYVHKSQTIGFECMDETHLGSVTNILM